jgi:hypothetical protein
MFNDKKLEELTEQVRELVQVNRALLTKLESQNKAWVILADHVGKLDNSERAAFGVTR